MDYKLIDSGNGRRLEQFGKYLIDRPDPQIVWDRKLSQQEWQKADARFERTIKDKGKWIKKPNFPESWFVDHNSFKLKLRLTPFKHTGVFPEQSWEWDLIEKLVKESGRKAKVLNLFGYTGAASLSALSGGAEVTHVDASRPAITWFKENQEASGFSNMHARIIIDDAFKFTAREIKRGNRYDGIIMDPPVYGHGPKGESWKFNIDFPKLLENISKITSNNLLFVIVNAYAISTSSVTLANILNDKLSNHVGTVNHGELTVKEESGGRILSTGIWATWTKNN